MIFILDKDLETTGILLNHAPESCPYFNDLLTESLQYGAQNYEFEVPADHPTASLITAESYCMRVDLQGDLLLFKVRSTTERKNGSGQVIKTVFTESAALELLHDIVRPVVLSSINAEAALEYVLQGTEWQPGLIEWLGIYDFDFMDYPTVLEAIQQINDAYSGDIVFRVDMKDGRIIGKYVDLLQKRGNDNVFRFDYTTDITEIERISDSSELITALIGVGQSDESGVPVTFTEIERTLYLEDGTAVLKARGLDYVENPVALQLHGRNGQHRFGVFKTDETDPGALLRRTWDELLKSSEPKVTYTVNVIDLSRLQNESYQHKTALLGDSGTVVDYSFDPAIIVNARIIERKTSFTNPAADQVTIGNFVPYQITEMELITELRETIRKRAGSWETGSGGEMIYKSPSPPENPEINVLWLDTSRNPEILKRYNGTQWIKSTPTEAREVGAITPGTAQDIADIAQQQAEQNAAIDATNKASAALESANNYTDTAITGINSSLRDFVESSFQRKITQSSTAPANPFNGDLWIDTSRTPTWKRWNGTSWVNASATSLEELDGQLENAQIAVNAIRAENIQQGAITSDKIAANSITAVKIAADAVTADKIAANSITSAMIATAGLDAAVIKFGTMSGERIAADSITGDKLQAGTVIAKNITFSGQLQGATGTFSGSVSIGDPTSATTPLIALEDGILRSERYTNTSVGYIDRRMNISAGELRFFYEESMRGGYWSHQVNFTMSGGGLGVTGEAIRFNLPADFGQDATFDGNVLFTGTQMQINNRLFIQDVTDFNGLVTNFNRDVNFKGDTTIFENKAYFRNQVEFRGSPIYLSEPVQNVEESGYCGIGGITASTSNIAGVGVNFKVKKNYTPSNITLQTSLQTADPYTIDISNEGFWLYIRKPSGIGSGQFLLWRGFYRA